MEKQKAFDSLNKEIKYMILQINQAKGAGKEVSEDFMFWYKEKKKTLKALGLELGYDMEDYKID